MLAKRAGAGVAAASMGLIFFSGCMVRTYELTRDRVDQDLDAGNRGYLAGSVPSGTDEENRKLTRTTQVFEIEFGPRQKAAKRGGAAPVQAPESAMASSDWDESASLSDEPTASGADAGAFESYTVLKGDTLQKISLKKYGTTKRWMKLYELNRDVLLSPDMLRPGQTLRLPVEQAKEVSENLK